jgi:hypothetical protein
VGWFEENPVFLVVFIVVTVEVWLFVRRRVAAAIRSRKARPDQLR